MTSFLFIISFLLHIITITAIIAINKQLVTNKSSNTQEIVSLMESYLEEIKNENKLLEEELSRAVDKTITKPGPSSLKENSNSILDQEDVNVSIDLTDTGEAVRDEIEVSTSSRILKLYKEGNSVEEIARKLGCGKTEVELIIKFHEKSNI
ncbi:helix-turn-helix domain-containing protein [Paucisalibacillus globulus]|uniref:helix-turn-helix domain-containing protein n=1 Tax=Paucisalibacillus globulus TaxID=351095 RepID=UPI000BB8B47B|nr:helix-turn-helix domain-containing protein [Paucisalibacillus globulus]